MGQKKKYDWIAITKKYLSGPYESVSEFIRWIEKRKITYPDEKWPARESINRASQKLNWAGLRAKKNEKLVDKLTDMSIDKETAELIKESAKNKLLITQANMKMLIHFANNPEEINMKGNLADLINDAKRTEGMVTKEQQQTVSQGGAMPIYPDEDSYRKRLEEMPSDDIKKLEKMNKKEMAELEDAIPVDELAFLEEDE